MLRWWPTALERRVAMRYLRGQRGTRSASLQTMVAIGGIAVGVAALIIVLGVMNGLRNDLRDRILVASPHLRVLNVGAGMRLPDWQRQIEKIRQDPEVVAATPEVSSVGMIINAEGYADGVAISGVEAGAGTSEVTKLDSAVVQGDMKFTRTGTLDGVSLGSRLALRLSVKLGDTVTIVTAARNRTLGIVQRRDWTYTVTGLVTTGMYIYDNTYVWMDRPAAQQFAGLDSAVSDIAVHLRDPWRADVVGDRLQDTLGFPSSVETWQDLNASLFAALKLEKLAMGLVILLIIVVAAFNIVGTLTMVVAFKTREIGILQAMGLSSRGVARIFLAQGAIVGLVGTAFGLALGLVTSVVVNNKALVPIDPSVYFIDHLPVEPGALDVLIVVVASLAIALVATMHPSRRAAQLEPVEAIRAE